MVISVAFMVRMRSVWAGVPALVLAAAVAGLTAAGTAGAATAKAGAATTVTRTVTTSGSPGAQAVVHPVGTGSQAASRGFWTAARMKSATPAGAASPQAAAGPPASPTASPSPSPTAPPGTPNPTYFNGVPTVGALFFTTGTQAHFCTASVVNSVRLDLVLTAAHCVYGSGGYAANVVYVPQWHQGASPYGAWPVTTITVAQGW